MFFLLTGCKNWDIIVFAVERYSCVGVAQLDRAFGYGPKGRGFESSRPRLYALKNKGEEKHSGLQGVFLLEQRAVIIVLQITPFNRKEKKQKKLCRNSHVCGTI